MTEGHVIRKIKIVKSTGRGVSDLPVRMMEFRGHYATKTPINYESPIVRCVALSQLVIRENEWRVKVWVLIVDISQAKR